MRDIRQIRREGGFTLVEIAIVLVIIGLLLGGVLKGQEIVKNAKVKSYKSNTDAIVAAYNAYMDRYKQLPGDDPGAVARLNVPAGTCTNCANGNGNSAIAGAFASATLTDESNQFFMHLAAANLIKANANAATAAEMRPRGPNGETMGVQVTPAMNGLPGIALCFGSVTGEYAELVDLAFDDGRPGTGSWRVNAVAGNANYLALGAAYKTTPYSLCTQIS